MEDIPAVLVFFVEPMESAGLAGVGMLCAEDADVGLEDFGAAFESVAAVFADGEAHAAARIEDAGVFEIFPQPTDVACHLGHSPTPPRLK
jgi:hypothetical protein